MTKNDIISSHYSCTCHEIYKSREMADPSCALCEHGGEIELIMDEWAIKQALAFSEWNCKGLWSTHGGLWYPYQDEDNPISGEELYDLWLKETGQLKKDNQ